MAMINYYLPRYLTMRTSMLEESADPSSILHLNSLVALGTLSTSRSFRICKIPQTLPVSHHRAFPEPPEGVSKPILSHCCTAPGQRTIPYNSTNFSMLYIPGWISLPGSMVQFYDRKY